MMRVAYVSADPGVPVFGCKGCSVHVQEVIRAMRSCGAHVELFAARSDGAPPPDLEDLLLHPLPLPSAIETPAERERAALDNNERFREALRRSRKFDLVYERQSLFSFAGMLHAREAGVPGVLEVNSRLLQEQRLYRSLAHDAEAAHCVTQAFGAASVVFAVSEAVAGYVRSHPARTGPVRVVPNGVDVDRFHPQAPPVRPAPPPVVTIGFIGTIRPWHDVSTLLDAFARVRAACPVRLLIVGDGPRRKVLQQQASALKLGSSVEFTGAVAPGEVPGLLTSMDIAVAPYPPIEEFYFSPLKLFEYFAAGRAVVASDIGQVSALIQDGVNGLLYPPGDLSALAKALLRLLEDAPLRHRLGRQARQNVSETYTWKGVAELILHEAKSVPAPAGMRKVHS